jgi:hypothetical protein
MAPYYARLAGSQEPALYVPIVRDPQQAFRLSSVILDSEASVLLDSVELLGTQMDDGRPATVGDLRAGRAADIYWEIEGHPEGTQQMHRAFWKTNTAIRWPGVFPKPVSTATFAFKHVIQARQMKVLDANPLVLLHFRKFREAVLKTAKATASEEPAKKIQDAPKTETGVTEALPDTMVRVSRALYVILNRGFEPELLRSGPETYLVPAKRLKYVSYSRFVETITHLEHPCDSD